MSADLTYHVIHLENGRLAPDMPEDRIAEIARRAAAHAGRGGIVLHFHGGLVPRASGMDIATRLLPVYGDPTRGDGYPVFFVWESGLVEIFANNLPQIAGEKLFGILWKRLARIVQRKAAQLPQDRAVSALPSVDTTSIEHEFDRAVDSDQWEPLHAVASPVIGAELSEIEALNLELELQGDLELGFEVREVSNGLLTPAEVSAQATGRGATVRGSSRTLMSPNALDNLVERPEPAARGFVTTAKVVKALVVIAAQVIRRFANGRDHGFHATLVEEILRELYIANVGGLVWKLMKDDTADAFAPDPAAGGTAFLRALSEALAGTANPRLTLVGHSTGAVYIAELLDAAGSLMPAGSRFDLVELAPAVTFERFAGMLASHEPRIGRFRMFAMQDGVERADRLVPVLYPHSLLYFVSGILEPEVDMPLLGMQRFHAGSLLADVPAVKAARSFFGQAPRAVWSRTAAAAPGWRSQSTRHGDFDNDAETLDSLATLVSGGW